MKNNNALLLREFDVLLANAKSDIEYYKFAIAYLEGKDQVIPKKDGESLREYYRSTMDYLHGR